MLSSRRLIILAVLIGLSITLAVARALQVQVVENPKYVAQANYQQTQTVHTLAPRGAIYDRNGNVLAVSNRAYLVRLDLRTITDTVAVANAIAPALNKPASDVLASMQTIIDSTKTPTPTGTILAYNLPPRATNMMTQTLGR